MKRGALIVLFLVLLLPTPSKAASFEISGWIPYWRATTGTTDLLPHIKTFTSLMPFGYIVQNDGTLSDAFSVEDTSATSTISILRAAAKVGKTKIIPTVMWSNGAAISAILKSAPARQALEDRIAALASDNNFDGIDIDFENKSADTRTYFSLFLKGLYARMGKKFVYCSIEARTPPSSAFDVIPADLEYANDYTAINKYCDRVEIMAYDQGTIDLRLNSAANQAPYIPLADPKWVQKVVTLAAKSIAKNKIIIGVPTYGYEYELVPLTQGYRYNIDWALNPRYATDLASSLGLTITRNSAGELSFVYQSTTTPATATTTPLSIVWWSDAKAIQDKIKLAKSLGVRGIAIFKLDGGEDPALWNVLPKTH
jgi:spore germination protein